MTVQAQACPNCKTQPYPGATFCHHCGATLEPVPESQAGTVPWTLGDIGKAIGLVILILIATSIPASLVAYAIAGNEHIERNPTALTVALGASAFLELALAGTALHFSVRKYGAALSSLGIRGPQRGGFWSTLGVAFVVLVAGLGVNFAYFGVLKAFGVEPETQIKEAYQSAGPLITLAILSMLVAPFLEELFFRGFVFTGLRRRWGLGWAALGSGMLFAAAHIGNPGNFYLIPPIAAIGFIFAWGYWYSGSLAASIIPHLVFNTVAFVDGVSRYS